VPSLDEGSNEGEPESNHNKHNGVEEDSCKERGGSATKVTPIPKKDLSNWREVGLRKNLEVC